MVIVHFEKKLSVSVALLACFAALNGCGPDSADAGEAETQGTGDSVQREVPTDWPTVPETGRVRQITKHVQAHASDPSLVLMSELPGGYLPAWDIHTLGIKRVQAAELEQLIDSGRWALVDVRKDKDITGKGTIPGSYHFEYPYQGANTTGETSLTREGIESLLEVYDGVAVFCNGPRCPRSFNGSIHLVQDLDLDGTQVRWFRLGVPAWTRSPLIPVARRAPKFKPREEMTKHR